MNMESRIRLMMITAAAVIFASMIPGFVSKQTFAPSTEMKTGLRTEVTVRTSMKGGLKPDRKQFAAQAGQNLSTGVALEKITFNATGVALEKIAFNERMKALEAELATFVSPSVARTIMRATNKTSTEVNTVVDSVRSGGYAQGSNESEARCKIPNVQNANKVQSNLKLRCAMTEMISSLAHHTFTTFGIDNALTKDSNTKITSFTKIRLVTMIHDAGEKLYNLPWLNKICWVNRVKLPWFIFKPLIEKPLTSYFNKIYFFKPRLLLQMLQYSEWVVWMDMDIMLVQPSADLQLSRWIDDRFDVIVTDHHRTPVNNGVVFFKRSAWTFDFLAEWLDICRTRSYFATDNGAFMELLLRHMPAKTHWSQRAAPNSTTFGHDYCCNTKAPARCRPEPQTQNMLTCVVASLQSRMGPISEDEEKFRSSPHIKFVNPKVGFNNHVWHAGMIAAKWPKSSCYQGYMKTPFVHTKSWKKWFRACPSDDVFSNRSSLRPYTGENTHLNAHSNAPPQPIAPPKPKAGIPKAVIPACHIGHDWRTANRTVLPTTIATSHPNGSGIHETKSLTPTVFAYPVDSKGILVEPTADLCIADYAKTLPPVLWHIAPTTVAPTTVASAHKPADSSAKPRDDAMAADAIAKSADDDNVVADAIAKADEANRARRAGIVT